MQNNEKRPPVEIIRNKKLIDKPIYGILALFFGVFGAHKFYIKNVKLGLAYLFWLPLLFVSVISFFLLDRAVEFSTISYNTPISYFVGYLFVSGLVLSLITAFISINESIVAFLEWIIYLFKPGDKFIYASLAFFLGIFGAHKFYTGKANLGWIYYVLSIPFTITSFIFLVFIATAHDVGDISMNNPIATFSAYFFLGSVLSLLTIAIISIVESMTSLFKKAV